jgi:tRNA/tmRNA/rRNA uracil-C5-methylase (TrmA/RlmC/RlmD family)
VANQLARLGDYAWEGVAEPIGTGGALGWRTRVSLDVGADGRAGFHRYHSDDLVTDLRCGQLPAGMLADIDGPRWSSGDQLHVVLDDDGGRHVVATARGRRGRTALEGSGESVHRVGSRVWRVPVTGFWQSHRDAPAIYSELVRQWLGDTSAGSAAPADSHGLRAWDLYGGVGLFAAALADTVGDRGEVLTVDTSRAASNVARSALADVPQVRVLTDSVRRVLAAKSSGADIAVLDPPRAGAGRAVIELLAGAEVARVIHIGCEAAAFARDIGLYRQFGFHVQTIRVFDAFPLTHHVECFALLTRGNHGPS